MISLTVTVNGQAVRSFIASSLVEGPACIAAAVSFARQQEGGPVDVLTSAGFRHSSWRG